MFYSIYENKTKYIILTVTFVSRAITQTFRFNGHLKDHQTHLNSLSRSLLSVPSTCIEFVAERIGECLPIERVL